MEEERWFQYAFLRRLLADVNVVNFMALEYQRTLPAGAGEHRSERDQQINPTTPLSQDELLLDPSSKFELLHPLGRPTHQ